MSLDTYPDILTIENRHAVETYLLETRQTAERFEHTAPEHLRFMFSGIVHFCRQTEDLLESMGWEELKVAKTDEGDPDQVGGEV